MKKLFKGISIAAVLALTAISATSCCTAKSEDVENIDTQLNATTTLPNATLANSIDNGNIFHAWDWSMSTIKANLDSIKAAGFTTIQTSPMQPQKDYWAGNTSKEAWWKLYQPLGFSIATKNNALGTKSELHSMVNAAHNKGLKVIVDVVANHLAGYYDHFDQGVKEYEPTIYGSNGYISGGAKLHSETYNGASDSWCTKNGNIGLPDLNTHDSYVQKRVLSLCKKYIDCGVDGFRFDAAKPIETDNSSEPYGASAFWPSVINGTTSYAQSKGKAKPYYHGEILYSCGNNRSYSWYTKYMDVIDNKTGNDLRNSFNANYAAAQSAFYTTNLSGDKVVVWAESHDTYANDDQESTGTSIYNINKTYAIIGSRNGAECLYCARPTDGNWNSCTTKLGAKGSTAYTW
jgi:alpha-amylase